MFVLQPFVRSFVRASILSICSLTPTFKSIHGGGLVGVDVGWEGRCTVWVKGGPTQNWTPEGGSGRHMFMLPNWHSWVTKL